MTGRQLSAVMVSFLFGMVCMYLAISTALDDMSDSLDYCKNENARYTHTVDGLVELGWSERRIQAYLDYGCIPYLEYVGGEK